MAHRQSLVLVLVAYVTLLVCCQAEHPVYSYGGHYPHTYYPSYLYNTYPLSTFNSYPVYLAEDYYPRKEFYYDPHHVHPYSDWPFEHVKLHPTYYEPHHHHHHHLPYVHDHYGYGYHGRAPVYVPVSPAYYQSPYFNVYNKFAGGKTKQFADARADASASSGDGDSASPAPLVDADSGWDVGAGGEVESMTGQQPPAAPAALPPAPAPRPSLPAPMADAASTSPSAAPQSDPIWGVAPAAQRPAAATMALPAPLADAASASLSDNAPLSDPGWDVVPAPATLALPASMADAAPASLSDVPLQSNAGWNVVAGRWYPRSGYGHIDHVRPKEAPKA